MGEQGDSRGESSELTDLRRRAEAGLVARPSTSIAQDLSEAARAKLLHELQTHHVELELQNDQLRAAQIELELATRDDIGQFLDGRA